MASLTRTAIISRKAIRYGIYAVILITIIRITYNTAVSLYRRFFPPKPEEPNVAFGVLPKIPFPEKASYDNLNYVLETVEGKLPTLVDRTEVYYMPPISPNIQALEVAKSKAKLLGFSSDGKQIVETIPNVYIFGKGSTPSSLTMNIITGIFSINYDVYSNPAVLEGIPPSAGNAVSYARSFLKQGRYLTEDLKESPATHDYLRFEGGKFVPAVSQSESNLIKVNLFRKNLGKDLDVPSVTPDMPESNIWFLLAGSKRVIIAAEYHYYPLDETKSGTYPLKTSDEAWEELKQGGAYIANLGDNQAEKITIRRIYLAYYDPGLYTEYYQPVVVFEGDNNFYAFVPAVVSNFYGKEEGPSESN